jgi:hypothetical protein
MDIGTILFNCIVILLGAICFGGFAASIEYRYPRPLDRMNQRQQLQLTIEVCIMLAVLIAAVKFFLK